MQPTQKINAPQSQPPLVQALRQQDDNKVEVQLPEFYSMATSSLECREVASVDNIQLMPRVSLFIQSLCDQNINKNYLYPRMFNSLINVLKKDQILCNFFENALKQKFGDYKTELIEFIKTTQSESNILTFFETMHFSHDYHQLYTPEIFFMGFLNNVFSGKPAIKGIKDGKLDIEYFPIGKEHKNQDWRLLNNNSDYKASRVVMMHKDFLSQPIAQITNKEQLDLWFQLIKEALPCQREVNGCFARAGFTASILECMGVEHELLLITPAPESCILSFNEGEEKPVRWRKHRVCAVRLKDDKQFYLFDFAYERPLLEEEHPCFNINNSWEYTKPSDDDENITGCGVMYGLREAWRGEQRSDQEWFSPNLRIKGKKCEYWKNMSWDQGIRKWVKVQKS